MKTAVPVALAAATLCAAAWWTVESVIAPARIRRSLEEGLSPFFPCGFGFESAVRTGRGRYRLSGFRAYARGRAFPWIDSRVADIETGAGGALVSVTLGSPRFELDCGPDFIPPGGFRLPAEIGRLPRVIAMNTEVFYPAMAGAGARARVIDSLELRFEPAEGSGSLSGSFASVLGRFSISGSFRPGERSSIRAVADDASPGDRGLASLGPLSLSGAPTGALTLVFGGGQAVQVSGSLSYSIAWIAGTEASLRQVRIILRGQRISAAGFAVDVEAASAGLGPVTLENVSVKSPPGFATFKGQGSAYGGSLAFRGATRPDLFVEGKLTGADLSTVPPGLLGAVTPSRGMLDADVRVKGGAVLGSFRAKDASLWEIPVLTGIGRAAARFGAGATSFRNVEGSFSADQGGVTISSLKLEGSQTTLELDSPGRISSNREISLDFTIRLRGAAPPRRGLPPFDDLARALSHAITDPITRALCFRMSVRGTLDEPRHAVLPPPVFRNK